MNLLLPAVPLRGVPTGMHQRASLAAENEFWSGLQCLVGSLHHSQVITTGDEARYLMNVSIELRTPPGVACSWLRVELLLTGGERAIGLFPNTVFQPSDAVGAARTAPAGWVDRDLIPGSDLPAYLVGWIADSSAVVWDVIPHTKVAPERVTDLLLLCEGMAKDRPVVELRLALHLHDPALGERFASFSGLMTSEEGGDVNVTPEPVSRFVESVLAAEPTETAGDLLARMTRARLQWSVLVSDGDVVGLVTAEMLDAAPEGASAVAVSACVPVADADTPVYEIAAAVRQMPDVSRAVRGAILVNNRTLLGFVRERHLDALVGGPTTRGGDLGILARVPVSEPLFECVVHEEKLSIAYYDPTNPPRCSHGDLMSRQRPQ